MERSGGAGLGLLQFISGLVLFIVGMWIMWELSKVRLPLDAWDEYSLREVYTYDFLLGGACIFLAMPNFVVAFGLWKRCDWAWESSLIFAVLQVILGIGSVGFAGLIPGSIVFILVNVAIVFFLLWHRS